MLIFSTMWTLQSYGRAQSAKSCRTPEDPEAQFDYADWLPLDLHVTERALCNLLSVITDQRQSSRLHRLNDPLLMTSWPKTRNQDTIHTEAGALSGATTGCPHRWFRV
ncbi:uncharacterized protein LOC143239832 [Tachypleus tridentatus]|uniref:uncharacterized protein LOC143239832 n=1 Tax=Tachypleus tridentatus TaxID=6853 RepID=UPI003FD69531